jgi:hypothetical protein
VKRRDLEVHAGGLYRCCAQSIVDWVNEDPDAQAVDGEKLTCRYEKENPAQMIVSGGVIRWFDPDYPPLKEKPRE